MSESKKPNKTTLHVYTKKDIKLCDALSECKDALTKDNVEAVGMLYATNFCHLARLDNNAQLLDENSKAIDLISTYEARVFSPIAELRWLHREAGKGEAALLTEQKSAPENWGEPKTIVAVDKPIEQRYLLWGESVKEQPKKDWLKMATARIGSYFVPVNQTFNKNSEQAKGADQAVEQTENKLRVQLKAREYLCQQEAHGNVYVAEERWLGLAIAKTEAQGKQQGANNG